MRSNRPKALIIGAANDRSLAWGIAKHLHAAGMDLGLSYFGAPIEKRLKPLAESVQASFMHPCNVESDEEISGLFDVVREKWGVLDVVIHSVASANVEDLEGKFVDLSREGFAYATEISVYSLIAIARHSLPLMKEHGGSIVTLTNGGSQRVVPGYHVMGVAKAALEATVRYLAHDLGPSKIRVNAISAGPVRTYAAMGISGFDQMHALAGEKSPLRENIDNDDVGALASFLAGAGSKHITGSCLFLDSGLNILGA